MNLLLDLYDAPVRGHDSQAVHLDSFIYDQFNSVLPKYCGAAWQQPPGEAGFCVNTRQIWWIDLSNLI